MSWHPNDLVSDADLIAYERQVLATFGVDTWRERRQKALEDWLFPLLSASGFDPYRLRTRYEPDAVLGYTSAAFTDLTGAAGDSNGITVSTVLAASTDYLYVGSETPFRGVSFRQLDSVNAVAAALSLQVWGDTWAEPPDVSNGTMAAGVSFSRGGAVTWALPETVVARTVNAAGPYFWARFALSTAPTAGTKVGPVLTVRRSRLCAAVAFRTLALIFREAPMGQDGPWTSKAEWYEAEAERAWRRASDHIGGEFDSDASDGISTTEAQQTAASVSNGGWTLERG